MRWGGSGISWKCQALFGCVLRHDQPGRTDPGHTWGITFPISPETDDGALQRSGSKTIRVCRSLEPDWLSFILIKSSWSCFIFLKLHWQTVEPSCNLTVSCCNLVSSLPVSELLVLWNWFLSVWRSEHAMSSPLQSLLLFYIDKPRAKSEKRGSSFSPFMCYQLKSKLKRKAVKLLYPILLL